MVVHPSAGHYSHTLVNALLYHCGSTLSGINGVLRPGIVHRIDMDTTGALVVCKTDLAHQSLALQLQEHTITRRYRAIVLHNIKDDAGTVEGTDRAPPNRPEAHGGQPQERQICSHSLQRTGTFWAVHLHRMPSRDRTHTPDPRTHGQYRTSSSWEIRYTGLQNVRFIFRGQCLRIDGSRLSASHHG